MLKTLFSFLFAVILTALTLAPSIVSVVNDDVTISVLIDGEEEEKESKEGSESSEEIEVKIYQNYHYAHCLNATDHSEKLEFYTNLYKSNFGDLISPPPEQTS